MEHNAMRKSATLNDLFVPDLIEVHPELSKVMFRQRDALSVRLRWDV